MLHVAKKYGTNLAAIRLSPEIRMKLPAWYHPFAEPHPMTNTTSRCLLRKHRITTVADLVKLTTKLRNQQPNDVHTPLPNCACQDCTADRAGGCLNPHACAANALMRIHELAPKYNPLQIGEQHDNLSLTHRRKSRNILARQSDEEILFDPTITCKDSVAECFRVFTDTAGLSPIPARRPYAIGLNLNPHKVSVYTDGACWNNGKSNARCGSGIWFSPNHQRNEAIRVPGPSQSNQVGETVAVIGAISAVPTFYPLTIISDSKYVIDGLTLHLKEWEDKGWIGVDNPDFFKRAAYLLKKRTAPTTFQWVKGHTGNLGNEESDKLAKAGANKIEPDLLSLEIPKEYDLQGAKLETITQATAYKGIIDRSPHRPRPTTERNLETIRLAIHEYQGTMETDKSIWNNLRKRTIRTRAQQFLFKAIHNTPMVGEFWFRIQNLEQRGICRSCNATESIAHILTGCTQEVANITWKLAKDSWDHGRYRWPAITMGIILGCGNLKATALRADAAEERPESNHRQTTRDRGATRLLQILISETTHLIWVLRCERVIQEKNHTADETEARWFKVINRRLTEDKLTATKIKRNKQYTNLIKATWENLINKFTDLPNDWVQNREVLVGRRTHRIFLA